jgi:hypothetical protein
MSTSNERHARSAGERARKKYSRKLEMDAKEVKALRHMTLRSLMRKRGIVMLFKDSRTHRKLIAILAQRDARLKALGAAK